MNATKLALEIEQKLKTINHYVAHGSYDYSLATGQVSGEHLDTLPQTYLDLLPMLQVLAETIKSEVEAAREKKGV